MAPFTASLITWAVVQNSYAGRKQLVPHTLILKSVDVISMKVLGILLYSISVLKSGYPNYPKSGYIRAIWPTENRCPKFGYSNSEKNLIFTAFFHDLFHFLHGSAYTSSKNYLFMYKNEEKILLKKIVRRMRKIMMKMMRKIMKI